MYVEDQEIEAIHVLRIVGKEPEHGAFFPYSVSWIFEKTTASTEPKRIKHDLITRKQTSIRDYVDKEVEEEKKKQILRAALRAPTAGNMCL